MAPTRTSRLMPFSRSQNSKTAKRSAFIFVDGTPIRGTKKSENRALPTLACWSYPASLYRSRLKTKISRQNSQASKFGHLGRGNWAYSARPSEDTSYRGLPYLTVSYRGPPVTLKLIGFLT